MSCSSAAGKTSYLKDGSAGGDSSAGRDPLKFANKDLIGLFRSVPWVKTLEHPGARDLWRTTAPGRLSETGLSEPYMVTAAAEFGSVFEFYAGVGEVDNFFSEVCMMGEDAFCLAVAGHPGARFIFAKRSALLRIAVPVT